MKKLIASLFLTIFSFYTLFACLNGDSKELKDGTILYTDHEGLSVPHGHNFYDEDNYAQTLKNLEKLYKETGDPDYLSDKGLVLILLKRYDEAIALYLKIEQINPNRYSTASNIGTAYELAGQNENALKWIKKAVRIDPASHSNSEWIHVKILEAKIKGEEYYTSEFLLNTDFGTNGTPTTSLKKQELQKLHTALYYQLNERISFVKPQEKIVAQLLFDLGNIAYLLGNYDDAEGDYRKAVSYGYSGALLNERMKSVYLKLGKNIAESEVVQTQVSKIIDVFQPRPTPKPPYLIYGLIAGVICLISFVVFKKARR